MLVMLVPSLHFMMKTQQLDLTRHGLFRVFLDVVW